MGGAKGRWAAAVLVIPAAFAAKGCALLLDYGDYEDQTAGTGAAGSGGHGGAGGGVSCEPGVTEPCYTGPEGTQDIGPCHGGTWTCNAQGNGYSACDGQVTPGVEINFSQGDEDCDGKPCLEPGGAERQGGALDQQLFGVAFTGSAIYAAGAFLGQLQIGSSLPPTTPSPQVQGEDSWVGGLPLDGSQAWVVSGQGIVGNKQCCTDPVQGEGGGGGGGGGSLTSCGGDVSAPQSRRALDVAVDPTSGALLVTGYLGYKELQQQTMIDAEAGFLARYDPQSGALGPLELFTTPKNKARGAAVAVDADQGVYVAGRFSTRVCIGGPPHDSLNNAFSDVLVAKFTLDPASGAPVHDWSRGLGSGFSDEALDVAVDGGGNALVVGSYGGAITFPDPDVVPVDGPGGAQNILILKLRPTGQVQWARGLAAEGNQGPAAARSVAADSMGNVLVAGTMYGDINLEQDNLPPLTGASGSANVFVAKLSPDGAVLWARSFGDTLAQEGTGIAVDGEDNVYVTGNFAGTLDLGGGDAPPTALTAAGDQDLFLLKLAGSDGRALCAARFAAGGPAGPSQVAVDPVSGQVVLAGSWGAAALDLGTGTLMPADTTPQFDIFLASFNRP